MTNGCGLKLQEIFKKKGTNEFCPCGPLLSVFLKEGRGFSEGFA